MDTRYSITTKTAVSSSKLLNLLTIGDGLPNPKGIFSNRYTSYSNVAVPQDDKSYMDDLIELGGLSEDDQQGSVAYVNKMRFNYLHGMYVSISESGDIVKALDLELKGQPIIIFDQISALAVRIDVRAYLRGITTVKIAFDCIGVRVVMHDLTAMQVSTLMMFVYQYGIMALLGNIDNHKLEDSYND